MFSKLVRRTHLYLALFLAPWMLMYALSTIAMNHRAYFVEKYGRGPAPWVKERETTYPGTFSENAALRDISRQLLDSVGLDGAHQANRRPDGAIVINRNDLLTPRRLTYTPATGRLLIERTEARPNAVLERFHRRRGYATGYLLDTVQGVNIMEFCKAFNAKTSGKDQEGLIIPAVITIYQDRSFTFITKTPPVPVLIKRAVNLAKGSAEPNKNKVGTITTKQVEEIAKIKMPDLNCYDLAAAVRSVEGTARSMGVDIV